MTHEELVEHGEALVLSGEHAPSVETDPVTADLQPMADDVKPARRSQAAQLVDLASAQYTLGVSDQEEPFGVYSERPHLAKMLRGSRAGVRADLARQFFELHDSVPSQQALADACMVLEGRATQQVPQNLHLRVASDSAGTVYIDMGDVAGRVVRISGGKWEVTNSAPVVFRRTKLTGAMPHPHHGELAKLWDFVAVDTADRPLMLAWMVQALIEPDAPHPVLFIDAEQGATKSSVTRTVVDLVDPSPVALRKEPRDSDQWVTAASASWVVALDNLSGELSGWLSDALCRASTGDGDVRRALYTDSDVSVVAFRRCPIINGVDIIVTRGDLAERLLRMQLKRPEKRREEVELAQAWEQARPRILGALLTLAAEVLYRLPAVKVEDPPRMADFAKVLAGVDEVLDTKGLERYREQSRQMAADTLDNPFIAALTERPMPVDNMTSGALLKALTPTEGDWKRPRDWPKNARAVTALLTRNAPALRAEGWTVENDGGRNKNNAKLWTLKPPEKEPEQGSPSSPNSSPQVGAQMTGESREAGESEASNGESGASHTLFADSPEIPAPTSRNEEASQASHDYTPSLVVECGGCCREIPEHMVSARERGVCGRCIAVATAKERL